MYWEQLELRCRYLYRRQQSQPAGQQHPTHHCGSCSCCDDCRDLHTPPPAIPWEFMDSRYWAPGRVGNLYSPNPEDHHPPPGPGPRPALTSRGAHGASGSAWSWRRLPWGRSGSGSSGVLGGSGRGSGRGVGPSEGMCIRPQNASSPDSQYGFSAPGSECGRGLSAHLGSHLGRDPNMGPYLLSQVYPAPQPHPRPFAPGPVDGMGMPLPLAVPMPLSLADDLGPQFYLWGPPPPYMSNPASAANSPARRDPTSPNGPGGGSPSPASPAGNPYPLLVRNSQRAAAPAPHRSALSAPSIAPLQAAAAPLDRPCSTVEDNGNNSAVDSLSSPEKTVPRKKRKKAAAGGDAGTDTYGECEPQPRQQPDSPESPTPAAQGPGPGGRKTKKRSDAPVHPGSRHPLRYPHRSRSHSYRPPSADSCCAERGACCSRAGDVSDDVDTEGYSYPRLKFPPPQQPSTPPTVNTDSQAILAAFDNQAFQEGASDTPGSTVTAHQGPVKTLTLGPQGPLVCKRRPADPNESDVYFGDDSSCCNVSEQHSSLTYEEPGQGQGPGRELRTFKLVHSHVQQRSMDSTRPVSVHRPSASTLSDTAAVIPEPSYHLHPIDTTGPSLEELARQRQAQQAALRQRMPLPLPHPGHPHPLGAAPSPGPTLDERDRLSLAPDAQYESIAESNVYTYISPHHALHDSPCRTAAASSPSSPGSSGTSTSAPPQRRPFKAACDSPHKAHESADDKENVTNLQREAVADGVAVGVSHASPRPACPPDDRPGIDV